MGGENIAAKLASRNAISAAEQLAGGGAGSAA